MRAADVEQTLPGVAPVRMLLKRMAEAGVIVRGAQGLYGLPEA
jgi:hypothetical protein